MSALRETGRPELLLFDIYDTILDMTLIERRVNHMLDSKRGYMVWISMFMQYSFANNFSKRFEEFPAIAGATLQMTHRLFGREERLDEVKEILEMMKHLPVHEELAEGLSGLFDLGFRMAALTNSPGNIVTVRMENTGLISYFESVMSAGQVKKYKPAAEVYGWAASQLQLQPSQILMVSSHGWDIQGAADAGMQTAFLQRGKQMLYPLAPPPDYHCSSLLDLRDQLAELWKK